MKKTLLFLCLALGTGFPGAPAFGDVICQIMFQSMGSVPAPYEVVCGCKARNETDFLVPGLNGSHRLSCDAAVSGWASGEGASVSADGYLTFKEDHVPLYSWTGPETGVPEKDPPREHEPLYYAVPPKDVVPACLQSGEGTAFFYKVQKCGNQSVALCAYSESCKPPLENEVWLVCKANPKGACPSFEECKARNPATHMPAVTQTQRPSPSGDSFANSKDQTILSYRSASQRLIQIDPADFILGCHTEVVDLCISKAKREKTLNDELVSLGDGGRQICSATLLDGKYGCPKFETCYKDPSVGIPKLKTAPASGPANQKPNSGVAR